MKTADITLKQYEDSNEMHFHEVDRKWIIEAMHEFASQSRWIAVKERLPEDEVIVLSADKNGEYRLTYQLCKAFWCPDTGNMITRPTHWMPIEPPKQ